MSELITSLHDRPFAEGRAVPNDRGDNDDSSAWLSGALIIGVPLLFWMLLLEVAAWVAGYGYGVTARLIVAVLLGGFLAMIWGTIRQSR